MKTEVDATLTMFDKAFGAVSVDYGDDCTIGAFPAGMGEGEGVVLKRRSPVASARLDVELEAKAGGGRYDTETGGRWKDEGLRNQGPYAENTVKHSRQSRVFAGLCSLLGAASGGSSSGFVPTEARIIRQERTIVSLEPNQSKHSENTVASFRVQDEERLCIPAFVARNPVVTMLCICTAALCSMGAIFVGGYEISVRFDTDNYAVDGHPATVAWEQWQATQRVSEAQLQHHSEGNRRELESDSCDANSENEQQILGYKHIVLVYEATGGGRSPGNLLTPETLPQVARVERAVRQLMVDEGLAWRNGKHFWTNASVELAVVDSVLNWFFPRRCDTCEGQELYVADGLGERMADIPTMVQWLMNDTDLRLGHLDRDFAERTTADIAAISSDMRDSLFEPRSKYIKTLLPFGVPLAGFSSICDRWAEQQARIDQFIRTLVAELGRWERTADTAGFRVLYHGPGSMTNEYYEALVADLPLIIASFLFLLGYTAFYCGSWSVAVMGVSTIALSFPLTLGCYRIFCGIEQLGVIHFVSAWIVLGVGADDIFVFMDTWKQSESLIIDTASKGEGLHRNLNTEERDPSSIVAALELRMSWVVREAAYAMLVTTGTTAAAFFGTALSRVRAVREFGLFMGIIVVLNYVLVLTFFAATLIYRYKCQQMRQQRAHRALRGASDVENGKRRDGEGHEEGGAQHEDGSEEMQHQEQQQQQQQQQSYQSYQSSDHRYALFLRLLLGWHRWVHRHRIFIIVSSLALSIAAAILLPRLQATDKVQRVLPLTSNMERMKDARDLVNECLKDPFDLFGSSNGHHCGFSFANSYGVLPAVGYNKNILLSAPISVLMPPLSAPLPSDCGMFPALSPFFVPLLLIGMFLLAITTVHHRHLLYCIFISTSCGKKARTMMLSNERGDSRPHTHCHQPHTPRDTCPATPSKQRRPRPIEKRRLLQREMVAKTLWGILAAVGLVAVLVAVMGLTTAGRLCSGGGGDTGVGGGSAAGGGQRAVVSPAAIPTRQPTFTPTAAAAQAPSAGAARDNGKSSGRQSSVFATSSHYYPGIFASLSPLLSTFEAGKSRPRDTSGGVVLFWGVQGTTAPTNDDASSASPPLDVTAGGSIPALPVYNEAFDLSRPGLQRSMAAVCAATGGLRGIPIVHGSWDPLTECPMTVVRQRAVVEQNLAFPVVPPSAFDRAWLDTILSYGPFAHLTGISSRYRPDLLGVLDNNSSPSPPSSPSSVAVSSMSLSPRFSALKVTASFGNAEPGVAIERHYEAWLAVASAIDSFVVQNSSLGGETSSDAATLEVLGAKTVVASDAFVRMAVELEFVRGTLTACALTATIACVSVAAFVRNVRLSLLVLVAVVQLLLMVGGVLVLKGDGLGVCEAVSLAVVLGMSVDYIVHLAHAYHCSSLGSRAGRARSALLARAGSVLSSAVSTSGCTAVLLFCRIQLFPQFATVVLVSIGCSLVCALGVFLALVMAIGPTRAPQQWAPQPKTLMSEYSATLHAQSDRDRAPVQAETVLPSEPEYSLAEAHEAWGSFRYYRESVELAPKMRDFALQCDSAVMPE
jgi:hypothetical protein